MIEWTPVVATLAGGVVGAGSAWFATRQQLRAAREGRAEDRAQRRRESAASTLGRTSALLDDLDPVRFTINMRIPESGDHLREDSTARWSPLRDELAVLALLDPSDRVRVLARELQISIANVYTRLGWIVHDRIHPTAAGGDASAMFAEAKTNHARAAEALTGLSELLRAGG